MICTISSATIEFKMSTTIDFRTMPVNVPSLCIPRVFSNIDERRIRGIFNALNMGEIARVDIVPRQTDKGEKFNRVFVHWKSWNQSENANQARERLLNGKEIKIVYDDPWFWKISAYREPVRRPAADQIRPRNAPRLQFDVEDPRPDPRRPEQRPRDDRRPVSRDDRRPVSRDDRRPVSRDDRRPVSRDNVKRPQQRPRDDRRPRTPELARPVSPQEKIVLEEHEEREQMQTPIEHQDPLDYTGAPPPKKLNFKQKNPVIVE